MTFTESIKTCLGKTFTIKGRASRSEFWWFYLFFLVFYIVFMIGVSVNDGYSDTDNLLHVANSLLVKIMSIAFIIISIAAITAQIRRLHDTGRSAWYILVCLIPVVSFIMLLWLTEGSDGDNEYGEEPTGESFDYEEYHRE